VFRSIYKWILISGTLHDGYEIRPDGTMSFDTIKEPKTCIPAALLREVLHITHDSLGHMGYRKTYNRITSNFYRPRLSAYVEQYVSRYPKCCVNKTSRTKLLGSLLPIDVPEGEGALGALECVGMDFIVNLPKSRGFDMIMVIIDKLTRYGIFIPTTSDYMALFMVNLFVQWVVRWGWLLSKFIMDRDTKFLSEFWQGVMKALHIHHSPSSAYHAQTDGATERLNQVLETMLRAYTSPLQNDWSDHLVLLKLAYNSAQNVSTEFSPVELLYIQPHDVIQRILNPRVLGENLQRETIEEWLEQAQMQLNDAREFIRYTVHLQKKYYDARYSPIPSYSVGDYVILRLDKHSTSLRYNKLSQQKMPPYKILRILSRGRVVQLDLPSNLQIHPVVSVQQVEPVKDPTGDFWRRDFARPPLVDVDKDGEIFEVEIVAHRVLRSGRRKYRMHWVGYPADQDQWVSEVDMSDALVQDYEWRSKERNARITSASLRASEFDDEMSVVARSLFRMVEPDTILSDSDTPFSYEIRIP